MIIYLFIYFFLLEYNLFEFLYYNSFEIISGNQKRF